MLSHHSSRIILIIGDEGSFFALFQSGRLVLSLFAPARDETARKKILGQLAEHPKTPVTILANGAAQEFRIESLPPVAFFDRQKLVNRRLQQAFPGFFATTSRILDRTHVMLAGLQHSEWVDAWCRSLRPENLSLGLLPVEGQGLLSRLVPEQKKGWVMLLTGFRSGGLRQIVTRDGQLVFTRQTPGFPADADAKTAADIVQRILADSRGYLARFGLNDGLPLHVVFMVSEAQQKAWQNTGGFQNVTLYSPLQVAARCGLSLAPGALFGGSDIIFAAWMAGERKLWLPLTWSTIRRARQDAMVAFFGWRAALAVLVLSVGLMCWNLCQFAAQLYKNHREVVALDVWREHMKGRQDALAPVAKPLGKLRAALERQRLFTETQNNPWDILQQMGQGLGGAACLTHVDWRDDGVLRASLRLDSGMNAKNMDRESVIQAFKNIADQLQRTLPDYAVDITHYPFPAMPGEAVTNKDGDTGAVGDAATAEVTLRRRS